VGFKKDLIGIVLIILAWFNPIQADIILRILIFILGFELMSFFVKLVMMIFGIIFPIFELLPIFLIALFILELILSFIITGIVFSLVFRPIILIIIGFLISNSAIPSISIGIIDFIFIILGRKLKL
jgi:hypothetical protein